MKIKLGAILVALFAIALQSCGGNGPGGGTDILVSPSENLAIDAESYLPLTPGIVTTFSDGLILEHSEVTVEGLTVSVEEGGIVKIQGRKVYSGGSIDIQETLKFKNEGAAIFLTGYDVETTSSDGEKFGNSRSYDPPVLFLPDKSAISDGDAYTTEHVNVKHEDDPETLVTISDEGVVMQVSISDLSDIHATVKVVGMESIILAGEERPVYSISLDWDVEKNELWFPFGQLSNGQFGLAKGIGIVRVAGREAVGTSALE